MMEIAFSVLCGMVSGGLFIVGWYYPAIQLYRKLKGTNQVVIVCQADNTNLQEVYWLLQEGAVTPTKKAKLEVVKDE